MVGDLVPRGAAGDQIEAAVAVEVRGGNTEDPGPTVYRVSGPNVPLPTPRRTPTVVPWSP